MLLFTAIVVVVDFSEHADDFVKSKLPMKIIITDFYFGLIPRIDAMLFPLFVFLSVIFFTSKMAGRSEIIAILSSGVSFMRLLLPYWIGSIILAASLWAAYQYIVPNANRKWADFEAKYISPGGENSGTYKSNIYFRIDSNAYAGIRGYDTAYKTGNTFFLYRFSNNKLIYNLRASNFSWDSVSNKWKLQQVMERDFGAITENIRYSDSLSVSYNFKPRDLRRDDYLKDQMATPELNEFINLEKNRGSEMLSSLLVERYNRDAIPVSVIILTFIGAILSTRKVRGGSGVHLAIGVIISVFYILFSRFSIVFATKGNFTPLLASWIPNIIFGILAVYLYRKAPK
ncbi:MAG: LptF/LptG family permease [Chitinophagaceae bacterium]|nr:LptF/LptG family permease [Chitinophagaceae bacterium]